MEIGRTRLEEDMFDAAEELPTTTSSLSIMDLRSESTVHSWKIPRTSDIKEDRIFDPQSSSSKSETLSTQVKIRSGMLVDDLYSAPESESFCL